MLKITTIHFLQLLPCKCLAVESRGTSLLVASDAQKRSFVTARGEAEGIGEKRRGLQVF